MRLYQVLIKDELDRRNLMVANFLFEIKEKVLQMDSGDSCAIFKMSLH